LLSSLPTLVVHADWGTSASKRWMTRGTLRSDGRYAAQEPELVGTTGDLLKRLLADAPDGGPLFIGFDYPIGLPQTYAVRAGIVEFLEQLPLFGRGKWADFYSLAEVPEQIGLLRPFYPYRPGGTKHKHLLTALDVATIDELRRRCELSYAGRQAAAPLFWTLGAQQVGRGATIGWKEVLAPAVSSGELDLAIWPFAGRLDELMKPGRVVIAETYPSEFYSHLGVKFPKDKSRRTGKRVSQDRKSNGGVLLAWAGSQGVVIEPSLEQALRDGFGASEDGEDPFDATVGLFGMLNVLLGKRPTGEPEDNQVRKIEGWILGQAAGPS
jgi:hypothetical protein